MGKGIYAFSVDSLHYTKIERNILKYYNLGIQRSSSLPAKLSEGDSGEYYITGSRASMKFYLEIQKTDSNTYHLTCYPE